MMSSRSPTSSSSPTSTIEVRWRDPSEPDRTSTLMQPWWYQGGPSGGSIQTLPPLWRMKKTASEHSGHFVRMQLLSSLLRTRSRSEEHTSELQSLMRISYAVFCLKKKKNNRQHSNKT